MEELVAELRKLVPFKDTTVVGDIVLLASHEPQMIAYALVTAIDADSSRKGSWWHLTLQILAVPPKEVVWTLREPQFTGQEIFSFGGIEHFMKSVRFESSLSSSDPTESNGKRSTSSSRSKLRIVK